MIVLSIIPYKKAFFITFGFCLLLSLILSIQKKEVMQFKSSTAIKGKDIYIANTLNWFFFIILLLIIKISGNIFKIQIPIEYLYIFLFLVLVRNISFLSPGFKIMKIRYPDNQKIRPFKILIINIFYFLFIWVLLLNEERKIFHSQQFLEMVCVFILFLYMVNMIPFVFIYKNKSLLLKILKLEIIKEKD